MALDDLFQHFFIGGMIPYAIRPDEGDWPCSADLQAIGLAALNARAASRFGAIQPQFLEAPFEVFPGFITFFTRTAFLFFTDGAQKNMAVDLIAANTAQRTLRFCQTFGCVQLRLPAIRAISA